MRTRCYPAAMQPSREPVTVEAYSEEWRVRYQAERRALLATLAGAIAGLERIGSTSVPGLAAKPTVDIMLGTHAWPWPAANDTAPPTSGASRSSSPRSRAWRRSGRHGLPAPRARKAS